MFRLSNLSFFCLIPLLITPSQADDGPGPLDFRDVANYLARLQRAQTPEAKSVRWDIANGSDRVAYERRATERAGISLNLRHLQVPLPTEEKNAGPIYTALLKDLEGHSFAATVLGIQTKMEGGIPLTSAEEDVLQSFVTLRQPVLKRIKEAIGKPQCVFQRDWVNLNRQIFFENHMMIAEAFLLRAESHVLFRHGRIQDAIKELLLLVPMAHQAASDPVLLCLDIGHQIDQTELAGLTEILQAIGPDSLVDGWIRQAAVKVPSYDLGRILSGEISIAAANFRAQSQMSPTFFASRQNGANLPYKEIPSGYSDEERRFITRLLDNAEAVHLCEMRDLVLHSAWKDPTRLDYFQRASELQVLQEEPILSPLLGEPFVSASGAPITIALQQARHVVLTTAASILAYAQAHKGAFPDQITTAVPTPALDPFTGAPITYRKEANGFVVYSVGQTRLFDGGKPNMKPFKSEAFFRFITPSSIPGK